MEILRTIIEIDSKKELIKFTKSIVITNSQLGNWITKSNSGEHGIIYSRYETERIPDHLNPTKDQHNEFIGILETIAKDPNYHGQPMFLNIQGGKAGKLVSKIQQQPVERRARIGHFFQYENSEKWAFFYADQRDTQEYDNHWKNGSHFHLITSAWPNSNPLELTQIFEDEKTIKNSLHIKFDTEAN